MTKKQKRILKKIMRWCAKVKYTLVMEDEKGGLWYHCTSRELTHLATNLILESGIHLADMGLADNADKMADIADLIMAEDKAIMANIPPDKPPDPFDRFRPSMN